MTSEIRISRPQLYMEIAHTVAKRATCMRLNVGAVIVKDRRIVSIGYNGMAPGEPHCAGNDCPGRNGCNLTIHAEENAISYLPALTPAYMDIYITDSPCKDCYELISNDGRFKNIFFATPYRINEHLSDPKYFGRFTPNVYRVLPAGYVMDWRTRELVDVET